MGNNFDMETVTGSTPCSQPDDPLRKILDRLPMLFLRKEVRQYLGNTISPRYLANLDCAGKGPKRTRVGKRVAYTKEDFSEWIIAWSSKPTPDAPKKKPKK